MSETAAKPLKILVTGALGAVGRWLVPALRSKGHFVDLLDLSHHHDPSYIRCDIREFRQLERIWCGGGWNPGYTAQSRKYDLVYHLAAEFGRWSGEDYYENMWQTNVIGTKNIVRMQEREGFKAIYFSSSEVYGDYTGPMSEEVMDRYEVRQLNDYALSKWVNEQQVLNSARQFQTQSVRIRLFNTYGPGETYSPYRSVICLFCYHLLNRQPVTVYRGHLRSEIYLEDAARTLAMLAERFIPGEVYNIGGSEEHSIETYAEQILAILNLSAQRDILVRYEASETMTTVRKEADCSRAARDLNHRPTVSLREGLQRTLDWMRHYYK